MDFLFSDNPHPAAAPAPATPASTPTGLEDLFETAPSSGRTTSHPDGMFGGIFGEEDGRSNVSGATTRVSVKVDSHETDTAERAALRQNRAQRVQDRIDKQLADKLARDRIEQEEQHQQVRSRVRRSSLLCSPCRRLCHILNTLMFMCVSLGFAREILSRR